MDKENLKNLFGQSGDVNSDLEKMFGSGYLDQPDTSKDNIPSELAEFGVHNIGQLLERTIEKSPELNCENNQHIILRFINGYFTGEDLVAPEEWWSVVKHMDACYGPCRNLYDIACQDKYLTPEAMKEEYGEKLKKWQVKND